MKICFFLWYHYINFTATCLWLQLSNKNVNVCKETQQQRIYTLDGPTGIIYLLANRWAYIRSTYNRGDFKVRFYGRISYHEDN